MQIYLLHDIFNRYVLNMLEFYDLLYQAFEYSQQYSTAIEDANPSQYDRDTLSNFFIIACASFVMFAICVLSYNICRIAHACNNLVSGCGDAQFSDTEAIGPAE